MWDSTSFSEPPDTARTRHIGYISVAAGSAGSTAVPFAEAEQAGEALSSGDCGESGEKEYKFAFGELALRLGLLDFNLGIGRPGAARPRLWL